MTPEAWLTLAVTAFSGLCFLMWNTDGRLDWVAQIAGMLASITFLGVSVHNTSLMQAATAVRISLLRAPSATRQAAVDAVLSNSVSGAAQLALAVAMTVLFCMPPFFVHVRAAKVR
jgi:hypothetical protein